MEPSILVMQIIPTFVEWLEITWNFATAAVVKYWWVLFIGLVLWYARSYRLEELSGSDDPHTTAFARMLVHFNVVTAKLSLRLFGVAIFGFLGLFWLFTGIGTVFAGVASFDPVFISSLVGIGAGVLAGVGFGWVTPRFVLAIFFGALFTAFALKSYIED